MVSDTTIAKYVKWSNDQLLLDSTISDSIAENVASITADDGLSIALRRGSAHLPWWSRLAIAEFAHRLESTREVAQLFNCSLRTVQLVLKSSPKAYDLLTGERRLSEFQISPPGMWRARLSS